MSIVLSGICPIYKTNYTDWFNRICPNCGQKLDWSEADENENI